tara:strand:- start:384 stop:1046 length:663 start_codon:yes stop_codon:yes gene_type:complete
MNIFKKTSPFYSYYFVKEIIVTILISLTLVIKFKKKIRYHSILISGCVFMLLTILFFFRNNLNLKVSNPHDILSPSSSKIIKISKKNGYNVILTWLSPLDKHFVIAPTNCRVVDIKNTPFDGDSERVRVFFEDDNMERYSLDLIVKKPMRGIGIFGGWVPKLFYNNRIIVTCKVGDKLMRGERFGLIRFGSNMLYKFPQSYNLNIKNENSYSVGEIIGRN